MMHPQVLISGLLLLLPAAVDSFPQVHGVMGHPVTLPCTYPVSNGLSSMCWGRGACASDTCGQTLIWTDGHRIYYRTNNRYQLKGQLLQGDVSLTIENVTESDSGLYCCWVETKGWNGVQRLTTSLQVQPGVPTSSSGRLTGGFKPINRPRPTPTSPIATLRKPRTTPRRPRTTPRRPRTTPRRPRTTPRRPRTTPKKPTTTTNSTHPIKPTPTSRRPSTTTKSTTTPRSPSTATKSITIPKRLLIAINPTTTLRRSPTATKSMTTSRRPATIMKPITTSRRPTITTRSTTTPRRPSTITKPTTTPRRPPTTIKPITTPRTASTTTKSTPTPRKPETTTKFITTSMRPATTTKYTITSTRPPNAPTSTRISASTPPTPVHTQTPKPVYTDTVTSSHRPWNNHTEVVPTPNPLKIHNKVLYIGISVSVVLLLLTSILVIIKCRHMRKKRKPEVSSRCGSIVFHDYKKKAFESTVQPQAKEIDYVIEDNLPPRTDSQLPSKMTSFQDWR